MIKDKAFLFIGGERTKQDGSLPGMLGFPCSGVNVAGLCGPSAVNQTSLQSAYFRENMLSARLDYNFSENMKWFVRFSYDNANEIGRLGQPVEFSQSAECSGGGGRAGLEPRSSL